MDVLCSWVKENESIDYGSETITDIRRAVDSFVKRLIRYCSEDGCFEVESLLLCGSFAEKTKLLRCQNMDAFGLEYDYLAVMKKWPGVEEFSYKHSCPGSMEVLYQVPDTHSGTGEMTHLSNDAGRLFRDTLVKSLDKRCENNLCIQSVCSQNKGQRDINSEGCCACTVHSRSGCLRFVGNAKTSFHLQFHWIPKKNEHIVEEESIFGIGFFNVKEKKCSLLTNPLLGESYNILVDLHPVLKIDSSIVPNSETTSIPTYTSSGIYLFPKCNRNCVSNICWRISTINHELGLISDATESHLIAYMSFKFLIGVMLKSMQLVHTSLTRIGSYEIKTIFMRHISQCIEPSQDIKLCVSEMLKDLSLCFVDKNLPHIYLKYNLIGGPMPGRFVQIIGLMVDSLNELLSKPDLHSDMADVLKDLISFHLIVWGTELKVRQRAWHEVGFGDLNELKKEIENNTTGAVQASLDDFVLKRVNGTVDETLRDNVREYVDLQILGRDILPNTQIGEKLVEWLKDLYISKNYKRGMYTL